MRCPHCGGKIHVTWNPQFTGGDDDCDDDDDDEEEEGFDEMGFTKRQFTGGSD